MQYEDFNGESENKNYLKFSFLTNKSNKAKSNNLALKIISFIAFIFFALNIFLIGFIYNNAKNMANKRLNVNYYNVNLENDSITAYAVQNAWQNSVCVSAGGIAYDEDSFFNETGSRGSGVIYDIDYDSNIIYILTCYHVISDYIDNIFILFPTISVPQIGKLVGYSNVYDIAVIKTSYSEKLQNCFSITAKNSQLLSIGENVFAVGNALSGGLSATCGIISRINKEILVEGNIVREIQTDASINPGNSGGGLFNSEGKFVGLINAKYSYTSGSDSVSFVEGTAFAIPGTLAVSIAKSIIKNNGFPKKIDVGIDFEHLKTNISIANVSNNLVTDYEVRVLKIDQNSPASEFAKVNDVVLSFSYVDLDGVRQEVYMSNKYCFEDISFDIQLNSDIEFNLYRPLTGEEINFKVPANFQYIQK